MKNHPRRQMTPNQLLALYYLAAIAIGSFLLWLPLSSNGLPLSYLDALFTATSAQCVTGLVVVDTATQFSTFGRLVILGLIQIGGIGITTFSVYLVLSIKNGLSIRGRLLITETLIHTPVRSLNELLKGVFLFTLVIEGAGALLLSFIFVPELGWGEGMFSALFHSVSAFCNAGFALFPDSLSGFRGDPGVNLIVSILIILGGIGFLVLVELWERWGERKERRNNRRLSLHSRLVLITSAVLTIAGALLILALEWNGSFQRMPLSDRFWAALFQSVSARTAGFNTIDLNSMHISTLLVMMLLMFVGASPGSCGGGIKTTSLALFVSILFSRLKGYPHTNIFKRTIPDETVTKTLTLVMLALVTIWGATFLLLAVEAPSDVMGHALASYLFEAVSAFATVGLSLGVTPTLSSTGKILIILLMFVGRVGLLTFTFAVIRRARQHPARYSEERLMIG